MACVQSGLAPGNQKFTYAQLEGLWIQAGGDKRYANVAAAVSTAESSGNSTAYCMDSDGSVDRGLWQINSVHGAQSTFDIMGNSRAAVSISNNGRDWSPWTTYTSGAYQRYLQGVTPDLNAPINGTNAAGNVGGATLASDSPFGPLGFLGPLDPFGIFGGGGGSIGETIAAEVMKAVIGTVLNPFIQIFAGILGMTGGAILMLGGSYMIIMNTRYGQAVKVEGQKVQGAGKQAALTAVAPEAGMGEAAAAGGAGGGGGFGSLFGGSLGMRQGQPNQAQRMQNSRAQAASNELRRRQSAEAKQMSTQQLLDLEARRYGGR